jgi:adenosylcobinamide kinase/adenosylcobinamide-phosphate guanylyltransferase
MKTLLLGGARSGKSSLASRWADERSSQVCAVVTAVAPDAEMSERIAAHRRARPPQWRVREEAVRLGDVLRTESGALLLIDCLTVWLSNCLWPAIEQGRTAPDLPHWQRQRDDFLDALASFKSDVLIVSNEVGGGIVPGDSSTRLFRDEHGRLNQAVAALCDEVHLVVAGLPLRLKPQA